MWSLLVAGALASPVSRRTPVVVAVERATPAVVTLSTVVSTSNAFGQARSAASAGSGVIVARDGVVLTNAHVVEGAEQITVHLADGRTFQAVPTAIEVDLDLAVIRLDGASDLPVIGLGDSDALMLGETAIAIGNPYGLGLTVSTGVVSSIRRDVEVRPGLWHGYVQTDAAINPGNSGGALVDLDGNLIGVNTAIRADAEGIGFAIPVNRARKVVEDVLAFGELRSPWLGIDATDVGARRLAGTPWPKGAVLVDDVHPGGPAERSGLREGDLVVEADGRAVASRADLGAFLADRDPGASVRLTVVRGGRGQTLTVRTEAPPPHLGSYVRDRVWQVSFRAEAGAVLAAVPQSTGAWAGAGLRATDRIVAIDGVRVEAPSSVDELLGRAKSRHRDAVLVVVARGRSTATLRLPI